MSYPVFSNVFEVYGIVEQNSQWSGQEVQELMTVLELNNLFEESEVGAIANGENGGLDGGADI